MTSVRRGNSKQSVKTISVIMAFLLVSLSSFSQIGEHRNDLSIGVNGGYILSNVGFTPKVPQNFHGGMTMGVSVKYVCEKYFTTICSLLGEINYASIGWKEDIKNAQEQPVINTATGVAEKYSRTINYIQMPLFAHLAWGKEERGMQFFVQAGPQFGLYLNESSDSNFDIEKINIDDRSNTIVKQYSMKVERKFDYGIAAGAGVEYSVPKVGHFLLEARYYYGLGNIYHDSKRDYFGKSNIGNIVMKMTYLFDILH
ncbi:MAG: porin family protein [Prevotella sp.]|nr:porin family protein [Prevotella sp.]